VLAPRPVRDDRSLRLAMDATEKAALPQRPRAAFQTDETGSSDDASLPQDWENPDSDSDGRSHAHDDQAELSRCLR
jgi:hypothetical protein